MLQMSQNLLTHILNTTPHNKIKTMTTKNRTGLSVPTHKDLHKRQADNVSFIQKDK